MKKWWKIVAVFGMSIVVCMSILASGCLITCAEEIPYVNEDNPIGDLLGRYQLVISGDVTGADRDSDGNWQTETIAHTMGAVLVGGFINSTNSIGDAELSPSFINNIVSLQPWTRGYDNQDLYKNGECPFVENSLVYYSQMSDSMSDQIQSNDQLNKRFVKSEGYVDVSEIMEKVSEQSCSLARSGKALNVTDGAINVDFTCQDFANYTLDSSDIDGIPVNIYFKDINDAIENVYILSITGKTEFDYSNINFFVDDVQVHPNELLQNMDRDGILDDAGITTSELNLSGMNIVFNFPDAEILDFGSGGISGHIVAPNAEIIIPSGNYNGGIIARELHNGSAEGHFYPMSETVDFEDEDETGELEIIKKFDFDGTKMKLTKAQKERIKFVITGPDGFADQVVTYGEFENGVFRLYNIPIGTYTVTEIGAETEGLFKGYVHKSTIEEITCGGAVNENETATFTFLNKYAKEPTTETTTELTTESTTELTTESTTELTTESTTELTTESTTELTTESTTELTTESTTELTTESTTELTTETTTELTTESTTELTTESTTELTTESTTELTTESTTELTTESTTELTTESTTELTTESTTESTTELTSTSTATGTTTEHLSTSEDNQVDTGDSFHVAIPITVILVTLIGSVGIVIYKKIRDNI